MASPIHVDRYHSYIRGLDGGGGAGAGVALPVTQLYNNFALGHTMYSDDGGDTWKLGAADGLGGGAVVRNFSARFSPFRLLRAVCAWAYTGAGCSLLRCVLKSGRYGADMTFPRPISADFRIQAGSMGANEDQLVELRNHSLLLNSRSLATGSPQQRVQSLSHDGGVSFTPSTLVPELPEPFNGCQGSIIRGTAAEVRNVTPLHPTSSLNFHRFLRDCFELAVRGHPWAPAAASCCPRLALAGLVLTRLLLIGDSPAFQVSGSAPPSRLYLSHPNPAPNTGIAPVVVRLLGGNVNLTGRDHMTVWRSADEGASWQIHTLVDPGAAGYSSLQPAGGAAQGPRPAASAPTTTNTTNNTNNTNSVNAAAAAAAAGDDSIWILYEQSDRPANSLGHAAAAGVIGALTVLDPDRFVLRLLPGDGKNRAP